MTQFGEEGNIPGIPRSAHGCWVSSEDAFVTRLRIPESSYRLHDDRRRHRHDEQAACAKASDERIFAGNPTSMRAAWNPRNVPFLTELRHPRPRGDLLCDAAGSIDRFVPRPLPNTAAVPELEPGAVLEGRALACVRAPDPLF